MRGVAKQLIGKKRVFAIGLIFYLSKEPKPRPVKWSVPRRMATFDDLGGGHVEHSNAHTGVLCVDDMCFTGEEGPPSTVKGAAPPQSTPRPRSKHLEIAAGARINQPIHRDPSGLSFWQDEPAAIIYINYCDEATARAILSQGKEDRTAHDEGFMDGLVVGHPAHTGQ